MGRKQSAEGSNKSEFIRNQFRDNPKASVKEIQAMWNGTDNSSEINPTLIYLIKSQMGLSKPRSKKKGRGRPPAAASAVAAAPKTCEPQPMAKSERPEGSNSYLEMEQMLEKLLIQAHELRDSKLIDDLRVARRRVSARLVN